jgi:hypothetical protein
MTFQDREEEFSAANRDKKVPPLSIISTPP